MIVVPMIVVFGMLLGLFPAGVLAVLKVQLALARRDLRITELELVVDELRCGDLVPFVDGELPADRAEAFQDHMERCEACQDGFGDILRIEAQISSLAAPKEPR